MNEQRYYVKLKPMDTYLIRDNPDKGGVIWIDEYKHPFTKTELAEIMDGAFYKPAGENCVREGGTDRYDDNEWINPLIELVPVEE